MILDLQRKWLSDKCTIGELYIDGVFECHTLEDRVRPFPNKVPKETAIWEGVYTVVVDFSPKYDRVMPHVLNVAMFDGIRIHPGNTNIDTEGCILVGTKSGDETVINSKVAFIKLFNKLTAAQATGEPIFIMVHCPVEKLSPNA